MLLDKLRNYHVDALLDGRGQRPLYLTTALCVYYAAS
jgi:hypothetical protein